MNWRRLARNWLVAFVDPMRMRGMLNFPRYLMDWRRYRRLAGQDTLRWSESYPCLTDWTTHTPFDPHYFYQGCWAARKLAQTKPGWHVDVGSSVMMVGVTSALAPTIFVDYRPLQARVDGLLSLSGDLLALPFASQSIPSLSCLHVLEHVGLGRYNDALNPNGSIDAAKELVRVLAPGGRLLFSTPVGRERVQFNAHRIFAPSTVLTMFDHLTLTDFAMVDDERNFIHPAGLEQAAGCEYACGMFEFRALERSG